MKRRFCPYAPRIRVSYYLPLLLMLISLSSTVYARFFESGADGRALLAKEPDYVCGIECNAERPKLLISPIEPPRIIRNIHEPAGSTDDPSPSPSVKLVLSELQSPTPIRHKSTAEKILVETAADVKAAVAALRDGEDIVFTAENVKLEEPLILSASHATLIGGHENATISCPEDGDCLVVKGKGASVKKLRLVKGKYGKTIVNVDLSDHETENWGSDLIKGLITPFSVKDSKMEAVNNQNEDRTERKRRKKLMNEEKLEENGGAIVAKNVKLEIDGTDFSGFSVSSKGGAIYAHQCDVSIKKATFTYNLAGERGGAIYAEQSTVSIYRTKFEYNTALVDGGSVLLDHSDSRVDDSLFSYNVAGSSGGGSQIIGGGVYFYDCKYEANRALTGGAMWLSGSKVNVSSSIFLENETDDDGGAIFAEQTDIALKRAKFIDNASTKNGGALSIQEGSLFSMDSRFTNNVAIFNGGAIRVSTATLIIRSTHFDGNVANNNGGAISTIHAVIDMAQCAFDKNKSQRKAGAVEVGEGSELIIDSSTFNGNDAADGTSIDTTPNSRCYIIRSEVDTHTCIFFPRSVFGQSLR